MDPAKIATVKALLELAANQAGTEEGSNAMDKAMRLMARYSIDQAMLDAHRTGNTPTEPARTIHPLAPGPYSDERASLAAGIAAILRVESLAWIKPKHTELAMVGYPSDLELATMLIDLSEAQLARLIARLRTQPLYTNADATDKKRLIRSAIFGWETTLIQRLGAAYEHERDRETPTDTNPAALVLRRRSDAVAKMAEELFPPRDIIEPFKQNKKFYREGVDLGREAAQRADLGQTRVHTNPHAKGVLHGA